jgi:hypothetical protein
MEAYFQWLRDKRSNPAPPAFPGPEDSPAPNQPDTPGHGFPGTGPTFAPAPARNLGFFALFSPAFLPDSWLGGSGYSPSTLGHFCCCLSIL